MIRRGIGAALSGLKTLIHNPRLLWLPILFALVFPGISIIQGGLCAVPSSLEWRAFIDPSISQWRFFFDPFLTHWWPGFYPVTAGFLYSLVMTFVLTMIVEIAAVSCMVFLLAGLVLGLSSKKDGPVSFFHGLALAKKFKKPLAVWSLVLAFAGTLIFVAFQYSCAVSPALVQFLSHVLNVQNPFNYVLGPNFSVSLLGGAPELSFAPVYFGLLNTLIISAINVLLFVLTFFVVPCIVLEGKSVREAVAGSTGLMKKTWAEVAACLMSLGAVVCAASLASLLFPAVAGGNIAVGYWPPPGGWLAAGFLYVLTLSILVFVVATVGGIALLDLYRSAKTGQMPGSAGTEPFP